MAKQKPKGRKSKDPQQKPKPGDDSLYLEETLEHATDAVRKFFAQYRVPMIVALCAVLGIFAIVALTDRLGKGEVLAWNSDYYTALQGELNQTLSADEIRTRVAAVVKTHASEPCAGWMTASYAAWLLETGKPEDRASAMLLVQEAAKKYPDDPILALIGPKFAEVSKEEAGFAVPPAPEPETPVTPATAGAPTVEIPAPVIPGAGGDTSDEDGDDGVDPKDDPDDAAAEVPAPTTSRPAAGGG